jgi:hypothetical protein
LLQVVLASCRLRRRSILPTCVLFRPPLLETQPRPPPYSSSGSNKNPSQLWLVGTSTSFALPGTRAMATSVGLGCDDLTILLHPYPFGRSGEQGLVTRGRISNLTPSGARLIGFLLPRPGRPVFRFAR